MVAVDTPTVATLQICVENCWPVWTKTLSTLSCVLCVQSMYSVANYLYSTEIFVEIPGTYQVHLRERLHKDTVATLEKPYQFLFNFCVLLLLTVVT